MKAELWRSRVHLKPISIDYTNKESVHDSLIAIADAVDKLSPFEEFDTKVLRVEPLDDLNVHVTEVLNILFDFADKHLIQII